MAGFDTPRDDQLFVKYWLVTYVKKYHLEYLNVAKIQHWTDQSPAKQRDQAQALASSIKYADVINFITDETISRVAKLLGQKDLAKWEHALPKFR